MAVVLSNCGWIVTLFSQFQLGVCLGSEQCWFPGDDLESCAWWARTLGQCTYHTEDILCLKVVTCLGSNNTGVILNPYKWLILLPLWIVDLKPVKFSWKSTTCQRGIFIDLMCIIHPKWLPQVVKSWVKSLHFSENCTHGRVFCAFCGKEREIC